MLDSARRLPAVFLRTLACAAVVAASAHASACPNDASVSYRAPFTGRDDAWDPNAAGRTGGGALTVDAPTDTTETYLYSGARYGQDAHLCADFTLGRSPGRTPSAGLVFWAQDYDAFFTFVVDPDTQRSGIIRDVDHRPQVIDRFVPLPPQARRSLGRTNEIAVRIAGPLVSTFLNGKTVSVFSFEDPPEAWRAGVHLEGSYHGPAHWIVTNFTVSP